MEFEAEGIKGIKSDVTILLSVPTKSPFEVDVIKPLKNLIQSTYKTSNASESGTDQTTDFSKCIDEFSKLRKAAIWVNSGSNEGLEIVYGYYDQICSLEKKIQANELQIPFKWQHALEDGSILNRIRLTVPSLAYEKVCILFNIAALQSDAANTLFIEDSDEGLKTAAKLYQQSAGIFAYLSSATPSAIPQKPTPDLDPEALTVLSNLMIAQAQEIFTWKAIKDNMKDAVIAKLACQSEELYANVLRGAQKDSLRKLWPREWIPIISAKQDGFNGLTQFYQSLVCRSTKAFGEEISRLKHAVELFKGAQSRSGKPNLFLHFSGRAQLRLTKAIKENDFIYNERVPDVQALTPTGKAQLAKAIPLAPKLSAADKDLFNSLVPVAIHQAMNACDARRNELVNSEVMKLREATQTLNGVLASLNLPAAIEVTASESALPQSIIDKSKEIREKGGVNELRALITDLPELLNRNREILDESDRLLDEERDADLKFRTQFKERWTRTPSEKLTEMFRSNSAKYREVIQAAVKADKVVRETFDKNLNGIELLTKSVTDLEAACPNGKTGCHDNLANCPSVNALKTLMDSVETIKAERDVIEAELLSATVNMKEQFLDALARDGAINEPAMSVPFIGQTIGPLQQQVQDSVKRQETLIGDIQQAHKTFIAETGGGSGATRDAFLTELATAYDNFITLQNHLREGTKFYNDFTQLLVISQNKISDYCFARKTEKDEFLKDLVRESNHQSPGATPTIPQQYEPTRPAPTVPSTVTDGASAPAAGQIPYPTQMHGMPIPYGASPMAPYPTYIQPPPMPQSFNPFTTLPYPQNPYNYQNFPQGPQPQYYGTYPGAYGQQQQQQPPPGYPQQPPPK